MKTYNRRQLIKRLTAAGISVSVFDQILNAVLSGAIRSAVANESGLNSMNFVGLNMNNGPARWLFDLPLRTELGAIDDLAYNPVVATGWSENTTTRSGGGSLTSEYRLINASGAKLPPIWENYKSIAEHGLFMRNVETTPIHPDVKKMWSPDASAPSLHALGSVIDSSYGIPAIVHMQAVPFYHPANIAAVATDNLVGDAAFNLVTKPFYNDKFLQKFTGENDSNGEYMNARITETLNVLKGLSRKYNASSSVFNEEYQKAQELLLSSDFKDKITEFSGIYSTYSSLITSALNELIPRVDADASGSEWSVFSTENPDERAPEGYFNSNDSSNFFHEVITGANNNYATAYNGASNDNMATSFALAHFFIKNSSNDLPLTNSLLLNVGQLSNFQNDTHDQGAVGHIIGFSKYFNTLLKCMDNFITEIGDDKFYDTLVMVSAEFNRSPQYSGRGSDHGFNGSGCSMYSGRIEKPILVGEIKEETMEQYKGEWGVCEDSWSTKDIHNVVAKIMNGGQTGSTYFTEEEEIVQVDKDSGKVTSEMNLWDSGGGPRDLLVEKDNVFTKAGEFLKNFGMKK